MNYDDSAPYSTDDSSTDLFRGLGTYYAVRAVLTLLGIGTAGLLGVFAGLLAGGVAGSVLTVALSLALFAVVPTVAAIVARRFVAPDRHGDAGMILAGSSF